MSVYFSGLPPCTIHGFHIHEDNDTITDGELSVFLFIEVNESNLDLRSIREKERESGIKGAFHSMKSSGLNFRKFLVTKGNFRLNDMRCDNSAICGFVWNLSEENSVLFIPVSKFLAEWKVSNEFGFPTFFV